MNSAKTYQRTCPGIGAPAAPIHKLCSQSVSGIPTGAIRQAVAIVACASKMSFSVTSLVEFCVLSLLAI